MSQDSTSFDTTISLDVTQWTISSISVETYGSIEVGLRCSNGNTLTCLISRASFDERRKLVSEESSTESLLQCLVEVLNSVPRSIVGGVVWPRSVSVSLQTVDLLLDSKVE